jgi:hypothetical protein
MCNFELVADADGRGLLHVVDDIVRQQLPG